MADPRAALWISEPHEHVWHHAVVKLGDGAYRAGCGADFSLLRGAVWPVHAGEHGPATDDRCHGCRWQLEHEDEAQI